MPEDPNEGDALRAIFENHRESLLERVTEIEDAAAAALDGTLTEETRAETESHSHKIAGSAGMFGYTRASEIARELEYEFMEDFRTDHDLPRRIASLVVELRDAIEADPDHDEDELGTTPTIHVLTHRPRELGDLVAKARERGLHVHPTTRSSTIQPARYSLIDIVILDFSGADDLSGINANALSRTHPRTPTLAIHNNATNEIRAQLAVLGIQPVLDTSTEWPQVLDIAEQLLQRRVFAGSQALVVTNDQMLIRMAKSMLSRLGLRVTVVANSAELWGQIEANSPRLVLLDMHLATDDAVQLHNALRQVNHDASISVLNITTEDAHEVAHELLVAGTDGVLTKPLSEAPLLDAAAAALERSHASGYNRIHRDESTAEPQKQTIPADTAMSPPTSDSSDYVDIMLVEDDEALIPLLLHTFDARGLVVEHAASGSEAIRLLATAEPQVRARVIVLDWNLPGASGLQVLQAVASAGVLAHTKVIMLTGRSSETEILRALSLGASDHVAKPFSVAVLMQRIESLLSTSETHA